MNRALIFLITTFSTQSMGALGSLEDSKKALSVISDFAKTMCADPEYKGSINTAGAGIKANAEVNNLLKKLADLNVQITADVKREAFKGLLQQDLLEATKTASSCRLEIYKDLKDRLLPKKSSVTSTSSESPTVPKAQMEKPQQSTMAKKTSLPGFKDLGQYFGLPADTKVGWGTPYETFEKLIPPNERTISKTNLIAVKGKASINTIPASTQYYFEERKLSSVRLVVETWYENYEEGNVLEAKTTFKRTDGDPNTGKRVCNAAFIKEVEQKADGAFSKIRNLEVKRVLHTDFIAQSYECNRYGCKSESKSDVWNAGYKNSEASDISLEHVVREDYYSYEGNNFKVGEKRTFSCYTQLIFSNKKIGGL